jgi:peptidoglycan/xylan/chitin deacetylase (PgdA/CDA1 family)
MLRRRVRDLVPSWRRRRLAPAPPIVLAYHSVGDRRIDPYGQAVRSATFAAQLRALQGRAEIVTANELVARLVDGRSTAGTAVVTFDDGYVDTLTAALPIAEQLDVPFTVFVTTSPLLDGQIFWWDALAQLVLPPRPHSQELAPVSLWDLQIDLCSDASRLRSYQHVHERFRRMRGEIRDQHMQALRTHLPPLADTFDAGRPMTATELSTLAAHPLVTIGAHTVTHPSLADLAADDQRRELAESQALLQARLGRAVDLLAYPFGKGDNVSETTRATARDVGYRAAFVTIAAAVRSPIDFWALPRLTMHEWTAAEFETRLNALIDA